jgi:glycosyltransferase involved in cell wall biosynthesis
MKVVIVRDRKSAGGGIWNYYDAVAGSLNCEVRFVDIGRPHVQYGSRMGGVMNFTPLRLLVEWVGLAWAILRMRPDIVHLNPCLDPELSCRSLRRDAVSAWITKAMGRRLLVFWRGWFNGAVGTEEFPGGNRGWASRAYRQASGQIVLAGAFRDDLRRWGFGGPVYVESTVVRRDLMAVYPATLEFSPTRPFNVLFLARVEVAKGVFEMLDAFSLLEKRNPRQYRLTIAGDGPDLKALKERVSDLNLMSVDFKGYVEGVEKVRCFTEASVFCFLSYTEGMPNAVLEAMAMGLPLVSSDAGGLKDILTEGETGYLLIQDRTKPAKERFLAEDIADRIERLAISAVDRERIGQHNAAYSRERFSAEKVAARLETIYRDVIAL